MNFLKLNCGASTAKAPLEEAVTVIHFCHHIYAQFILLFFLVTVLIWF